jgi:bacillopeptidase F
MMSSRLGRFENRKAQQRLLIALAGSIGVLVFIALFGVKILVGFSLLVDRIRGNSPVSTQTQANLLLPPVLDPISEATHSAMINISGKAASKAQVIIYINDEQYKKVTAGDDGVFALTGVPLESGSTSISSKVTDDKGNTSELSNVIKTTADDKPPKLEITKPEDNAKIQDGSHKVVVEGKTDEDARVTVNDRIIIVRSGGSFSSTIPIPDGDTTLTITATDPAGNNTTEVRKVTYQN